MKKTLLLFLLTGFLSPLLTKAQYINTLSIQYSNPGVNNNIQVIAEVLFRSTPPKRIGYTSFINNDTLYLTACYHSGPLTAISQLRDTLQVGTVPSTIRGLHFRAYWSGNQNVCDSTIYDKKTVAFVVQNPTGITGNAQINKTEVYPNPANDFVWIASSPLKQISLRDLSGKLILTNTYRGETSVKLDVATLPKSVYFLETITRDGKITRKRLLKKGDF